MTKLREIYCRIKPYFLVVHTPTGNAVIFDRKYKKMAEYASVRLIEFAKRNHTLITHGIKPLLPEQQPKWMQPGMEVECIGYHLYKDSTSTRDIGNIPED